MNNQSNTTNSSRRSFFNESAASRRSFFTKSAALFGAGALASRIMSAQPATTGTASTDLDILNYALALENLEAAFYVQGLARFTATDFASGNNTPVFGSKINGNVLTYIGAIRDHEVTHVATLKTTITSLGGTPVAPCVYSFGVNNVNDFLTTAMALENTGVMAYDGAIALITNPDVKQAAATIATVEARHASYLNVLNGAIPFPAAFDTPKSMADILAIAGQFITSCPAGSSPTANPAGPTIRGLSASITTTDPQVSFDLSQSSAAGGNAVSFLFTQVSGPQAAITGARASNPQVFLLGGKGVYVFQVVATDAPGNSQTGRTTITYK
jgi:Ferritin-like domain